MAILPGMEELSAMMYVNQYRARATFDVIVLDRKEAKRMDRFVQFAVVAVHEALRTSGLDLESVDRRRVGALIGSGIGGMETFEDQHTTLLQKGPGRVSPFFIPMGIANVGNFCINRWLYKDMGFDPIGGSPQEFISGYANA